MKLPSVVFLSLTVHLASTLNSKRNLEKAYHSPDRSGPGVEYSEYTDYDTKLRNAGRTMAWDSSPAESREVISQGLTETKENQHKVLTKSTTSNLKLVPNWPDPSKQLGQVAAVDIDTHGNVIVFHRGSRVWGSQTFTYNNIYTQRELGPIQQNSVVVFNATTGLVEEEWGSNMFYLPHGLTVDFENNIWVTDVALHQVFKFPANQGATRKPSLTLGEPFVPGNDDNHFCKPTDVAILASGDFFVSDGYCNSRIIKYDKTGRKLMEWGRSTLSVEGAMGNKPPPDHFLIPHALAVAEEKNILFVADRENGRVQCFNTSSGVYIRQLHSHIMGPRIFSVAYAPVHGGLLYIVNGPPLADSDIKVGGFVVSLVSDEIIAHFNSNGNGFQNPHDVAVTKDGSQIYAVELNPFKVWKFVQGNLNTSFLTTTPPPPKSENASFAGNLTSASQTAVSSKIVPEAMAADAHAPAAKPVARSKGSMAATVIAIASVVAVIIIALTVVILRIRRGSSNKYSELDMYYE